MTPLDVRFKNQGLDSIEVQDNGSGVSPENYSSLALKHYTSKLSAYDDLSDLQTFGFRGEALSSLSALSQLSVATCQASDAPKGTKLKFSSSGALEETSVVSAKQGTTVLVENLFHNLPVRRRELERHIKREWAKVISLLNQYACILTGVKFTVSQQPNKGRKIVMFSTKGNPTTRENIINIFGAKTMAAMIPLELVLEMEPTSSIALQRRNKATGSYKVTVKGHVSRPAHGEGRQAPDRQMFFVNGRPCGLPQFAKIFNEVYRAFNSSQSPFIFADIQLDTHLYDVNVSPDKRSILLHEQGRMLESLRESLNALFETQDYTVPASQLATQKTPSVGRLSVPQTTPGVGTSSPSPSIIASQTTKTSGSLAEARAGDSEAESTPASSGPKLRSADSLTTSLISSWVQKKTSSEPKLDSSLPPSEPPDPVGGDSQESAANPESLSTQVPADLEPPTAQIADPFPQEGNGISRRVQDFHSRLEELKQKPVETSQSGENEEVQRSPSPAALGEDLPGFRSASSLFNSRKRAPPDVATVTIGDQTVTSLIGSAAKRRREDSSPTSARATSPSPRKPKPSTIPSFGGRLSQLFSANPSGTEEAETQQPRTKERDPIEDSDMSEGGEPDEDAPTEEKLDHTDEASDGEPPESVDTSHADRVTSGTNFQPLVTDTEATLAKDAQDDARESGTEEPTPRPKTAEAPLDRRTPAFKLGNRRKEPTLQCEQHIRGDMEDLSSRVLTWRAALDGLAAQRNAVSSEQSATEVNDAEEKLSLTISKGDFNQMKIIGQFNLGFILAVRPAGTSGADESAARPARQDELFIIDQHASDEKYNFERLQTSTVVQSQRLVHSKTLDLTALEEEVVLNNLPALETNGFKVAVDETGDQPVGARCQLLALPLSKETTFSLADLEELISLLEESHATSETTAVPRPSKVRKMFAMRACRSSIMIGNALQRKQMERLVRHMGELDKPWNCPHGRPTMRHLCSLGAWDRAAWEGDRGTATSGLGHSWADYLDG